MPTYRHTQRANLILGILAFAAAVEIVVALIVNQPFVWLIIAGVLAVMAVVGWLFSSLTVEVTDNELRWHFGPGFWKKRLERSQITSVVPARTKWWYGWGIRITPRGWLYNVSGFDVVEVRQASERVTLIGTDQPRELATALGF